MCTIIAPPLLPCSHVRHQSACQARLSCRGGSTQPNIAAAAQSCTRHYTSSCTSTHATTHSQLCSWRHIQVISRTQSSLSKRRSSAGRQSVGAMVHAVFGSSCALHNYPSHHPSGPCVCLAPAPNRPCPGKSRRHGAANVARLGWRGATQPGPHQLQEGGHAEQDELRALRRTPRCWPQSLGGTSPQRRDLAPRPCSCIRYAAACIRSRPRVALAAIASWLQRCMQRHGSQPMQFECHAYHACMCIRT